MLPLQGKRHSGESSPPLALDGKWQKLEKIRILMGDEVSQRTRQALLDGLRSRISASRHSTSRENLRLHLFRCDFPIAVSVRREDEIPVVIEEHMRTRVTHLEARLRRVLMLGEVVAGKGVPHAVRWPLFDFPMFVCRGLPPRFANTIGETS